MQARFTGTFRAEINFSLHFDGWVIHRQNTKNNWNNSANVASGLFASRPSSPGYESAVCSCDFGKEQYLFAAAPCVWSGCPLKMPIGDRSSVFHHWSAPLSLDRHLFFHRFFNSLKVSIEIGIKLWIYLHGKNLSFSAKMRMEMVKRTKIHDDV